MLLSKCLASLVAISLLSVASAGEEMLSSAEGKITLNGRPLSKAKIIFHVGDGQFVGARVNQDGTYKVDRDVPITHVMIYLGKQKGTNKPIMVGASDGRSYNGERRFGVSVFDFKLPNGTPNKSDPDLVARFEGYSSIPGLWNEVYTVQAATPAPAPAPKPFLRNAVSPQPTPTSPKMLSNGD